MVYYFLTRTMSVIYLKFFTSLFRYLLNIIKGIGVGSSEGNVV